MDGNSSSPERVTSLRPSDRLDASRGDIEVDVVHSEENILMWMEYLPQDCIETMIRMGWDCTT
jgi:hypothetical protein